jgi:hypothetical protein
MLKTILRVSASILLLYTMTVISPSGAAATCKQGYVYSFTNSCSYPVWIGQRSTNDKASHPPDGGNWAISGRCSANTDCASGVCDKDSGQCTCKSSSQCPGNSPCLANSKCALSSNFCMPTTWISGTFWPRTGCVLNSSASPKTLTCKTGGCFKLKTTEQLLDCSVNNNGGSPNNPVTQFEVTAETGAVNYDVSIAAGFNVETFAETVGGGWIEPGTPATQIAACLPAGCTADLNATCPANLQVKNGSTVIGCLDPCTQCQRGSAKLNCNTTFSGQTHTDCSGKSHTATYKDMYCAKNSVEGHPQASPNQGTATSFGQEDCFYDTTFVKPTFKSSYKMPSGQGVCLYTKKPQLNDPHFNDYGWHDGASNTDKSCGGFPPKYTPLPDGTPCGGYLTIQNDGATGYPNALGYTCQTATYKDDYKTTRIAHLCMPPVISGLGACVKDNKGLAPLYTGMGGVTNPSWLTAGITAGSGGVPYYVTFKTACPFAYTWQYDDISSGFGCNPALKIAHGESFDGFHVSFCKSSGTSGPDVSEQSALPALPPLNVVALSATGSADNVGTNIANGVVRISGSFYLPDDFPIYTSLVKQLDPSVFRLDRSTLTLVNVIDESGAAGELTRTDTGASLTPVTLDAKYGSTIDRAIFETAEGVHPHIKIIFEADKTYVTRINYYLTVDYVTIAAPFSCSAPVGSDIIQTELETSFVLQMGSRPELFVGALLPWNCLGQKLRR